MLYSDGAFHYHPSAPPKGPPQHAGILTRRLLWPYVDNGGWVTTSTYQLQHLSKHKLGKKIKGRTESRWILVQVERAIKYWIKAQNKSHTLCPRLLTLLTLIFHLISIAKDPLKKTSGSQVIVSDLNIAEYSSHSYLVLLKIRLAPPPHTHLSNSTLSSANVLNAPTMNGTICFHQAFHPIFKGWKRGRR